MWRADDPHSGCLLNELAFHSDNVSHKIDDEEHEQLVDETFLAVRKKLRQKGLLKKEVIQTCNIINP